MPTMPRACARPSSYQPLEHLRLAGEMAVQGRFGKFQFAGQRGGGDLVAFGLLQHLGQSFQNLLPALAWRCACHGISTVGKKAG
jgi:hypothetical protein